MDTGDIFATKGMEYLLVIGYLSLLVPFWLLLHRKKVKAVVARATQTVVDWFRVPEGIFFHRGHTWAAPEEGNVLRVGMDDFARKLVGGPDGVRLPPSGAKLEQGEIGFQVEVDSDAVDLLSPVGGEVIAINREAVEKPELVKEDPFGKGWLMKVRVPNASATLKGLLTGDLARAWMNDTVDKLRLQMGGELGMAYQDGGEPVDGFVRQLSPDKWRELTAEMLLTKK